MQRLLRFKSYAFATNALLILSPTIISHQPSDPNLMLHDLKISCNTGLGHRSLHSISIILLFLLAKLTPLWSRKVDWKCSQSDMTCNVNIVS